MKTGSRRRRRRKEEEEELILESTSLGNLINVESFAFHRTQTTFTKNNNEPEHEPT